jgi:hypothetical protein
MHNMKTSPARTQPHQIFYRSPAVVGWLGFATLGSYSFYWFYRHFRDTTSSRHPGLVAVVKTLLVPFTIYLSLGRIIKTPGLAFKYSLFYFFASISTTIISFMLPGNTPQDLILGLLFGIAVQGLLSGVLHAIQQSINAEAPANTPMARIYPGEIVFTVLGALSIPLITLLIIVIATFPDAFQAVLPQM